MAYIFIAGFVYTINIYSNINYNESNCNWLRVIQQDKKES